MNLSIIKHFADIDIVTAFQEVAKLNIQQLEDAGCGMYNLFVPIFEGMSDCIVQVYPNDEYHNVWILVYDEDGEHVDVLIEDFPTCVQKQILKNYMEKLHVSQIVNIF